MIRGRSLYITIYTPFSDIYDIQHCFEGLIYWGPITTLTRTEIYAAKIKWVILFFGWRENDFHFGFLKNRWCNHFEKEIRSVSKSVAKQYYIVQCAMEFCDISSDAIKNEMIFIYGVLYYTTTSLWIKIIFEILYFIDA